MNEKVTEKYTILVVDDEESIRKTLEGVFQDEGFDVLTAGDGETAINVVKDKSPSMVLLDIWMPGMDGMETLEKIKALDEKLPVVMISGHATIATAIQATKKGAENFIEKPLDLDIILETVRSSLGIESKEEDSATEESAKSSSRQFFLKDGSSLQLKPLVFEKQGLRGKAIQQKTLAGSTVLYGHGVHTGRKSGLLLEPLPADTGIHFDSMNEGEAVPAHVTNVKSTGWATGLGEGYSQTSTVEHLMSALHAYGISNLMIKCNEEVPVMDGSALEFCRLIEEVGIEEQEGEWYEIALDRTYRVGDDKQFLELAPADEFTMDYTLKYPEPVGEQRICFSLGDPEQYKTGIAPARTFGFVKDIGALQKAGMAQGGRFDNFVLIGEDGVINDDLRFPDEAVRHKILDLIGDFYLLGRPLRAKVTACMTGHSDNIEIMKMLWKEIVKTAS